MLPSDCYELYDDPIQYDAHHELTAPNDLAFYLEYARRYGDPILELACGTGRVTLPLAGAGHRIIGLDINDRMLGRAKEKAVEVGLTIDWVQADLRDFHLIKKFNLIFVPFNSFLHIQDLQDIEASFACIKEHLKPQGRFILDIFNPRLDLLLRTFDDPKTVVEYKDPYGRGLVKIIERGRYDAAKQIRENKWFYDIGKGAERYTKELTVRIYFPQEIDALLHYNGFKIENKLGDYDSSPFTLTSPKQLLICTI